MIPTGVKDDEYEIHMGSFHDKPGDLLDILFHLNKKSWMSPELLKSTIECIELGKEILLHEK